KKGEWAEAIILFSMGLLPSFRNKLKDQSLTIAYVFADHLVQLLSEIQSNNPEYLKTVLYTQTEKPHSGLGRLLNHLGFNKSDIISGDGYPFWDYELVLPSKNHTNETPFILTNTSVRYFLDQWLGNL
ncbi:MAG: hypothetical protein ACYDH2_13905, partial [Anaerolineaceae bacterium]